MTRQTTVSWSLEVMKTSLDPEKQQEWEASVSTSCIALGKDTLQKICEMLKADPAYFSHNDLIALVKFIERNK